MSTCVLRHNSVVITDHPFLVSITQHRKCRTESKGYAWNYNAFVKYCPVENNISDFISHHLSEEDNKILKEENNISDFISHHLSEEDNKILKEENNISDFISHHLSEEDNKILKEENNISDFISHHLSEEDNKILKEENNISDFISHHLSEEDNKILKEERDYWPRTYIVANPSQAKPSQAKPSQAKPSQAKPSQASVLKSEKEPLKMTTGPWKNVATGFHGPLASAEYLSVVIDEYSRFPVVDIVNSTSYKTVPSKYGIPQYPKKGKSFLLCSFFVHGRRQPTQSQLIQIYSVDWTDVHDTHNIEHRTEPVSH